MDRSVDRALAYLARRQEKDGAFKSPMKGNTGITSLCVLAFLAKGHTPGKGPYGQVINKGIDYVLAQQQPTGLLVEARGSPGLMYSHCISTLMLAEASGRASPQRQKRIDAALAKALKLILAAQKIRKRIRDQGGWRYQPTSRDSDISVTGWAIAALCAARKSGAVLGEPDKKARLASIAQAVDAAVAFVLRCRAHDGGFAYQPGTSPGLARTGAALLCLRLSGRGRDATCIGAGKYILAHLPRTFGAGYFYYGVYYCARGMSQLGGSEWERFAPHLYEMMLRFQNPDGSWPLGASAEARAGASYATAMAVLALTAVDRKLPASRPAGPAGRQP